MRIQIDKIESDPPHAFTARDLKRILAALPPEWLAEIASVRLVNTTENPWRAFLNRYEGHLTVHCRGQNKEQALTMLLSELAGHQLGKNNRGQHHRSRQENHRLAQLVQPLVTRLLPAITPKKAFLHHSSPEFKKVIFPDHRDN